MYVANIYNSIATFSVDMQARQCACIYIHNDTYKLRRHLVFHSYRATATMLTSWSFDYPFP
jgi:hypothetical protein